jgi:hypothetical protein
MKHNFYKIINTASSLLTAAVDKKPDFIYLFIFYSFIHMCIHCLGHFFTLPPSPTLPPLPSLVSGRSRSALITDFIEERHKHNKEDKVFLLVELRIAI